MSIEDQSSKLEMYIMGDYNKVKELAQNGFKDLNIEDIQNNFHNLKNKAIRS
jgi:hypothetical protein